MGGLCGVVSKGDCVDDLFYATDYHSHLGTHRGGMAVLGPDGVRRSIHNIQNAPFRSKFEHDVGRFAGRVGIGVISDTDPQPLVMTSKLGTFAIVTVGLLTNIEELKEELFNLRFQLAVNQLENTNRIGEVKRDIARVMTVMNEKKA